jgi:leucyl aminopeptidase
MSLIHVQFQKDVDQADLLIVPLGVGQDLPPLLQQIDADMKGGVKFNIKRENFQGMKGEAVEFTTNGLHKIPKVILIGVGDALRLPLLEWQMVGGLLSQYLKGQKIAIIAQAESAAELLFGLKLRAWRFDKYLSKIPEDQEIILLTSDPEKLEKLFTAKEFLYRGVALARELTVEPANHLYPDAFARRCLELVSEGVRVEIYDETALQAMGAEAILSVGKSSVHPPRMVVMRWNGGAQEEPYTALVGKGVCFDSGGINLKTKELVEMKFDKAAAAAVTGTFLALAKFKVPKNVVGVIGLVENMVDGASMRPGDIITTLSGKTVEVVDTDYEGRLVLADCLWHVQEKFRPAVIIDLGTLTPETIAPLADEYGGLYCEDGKLTASLLKAGWKSGEKVWHLPMGPNYAKQIESEYADIKNMGIPGFGEGAAAAEFLKCFIQPGVRFAHLDIAGVAWTLAHCPLNRKGITGFGVRLLMEWLQS